MVEARSGIAALVLGFACAACGVDAGNDEPSASSADTLVSTTVFEPVADSWTRSGSSVKSNKGTTTVLYADARDSGDAERRIYLKFDVRGIAGKTVRSAKLRLASVSGSDSAGRVHAVSDTTWGETQITWSNQPALGDVIATGGSIATGAVATFDVTSALGSDGLYSFAITTTSLDEVKYASRESASGRPELSVELDDAGSTTSPPPPPPPPPPPSPPAPDAGDYLLLPLAELKSKPMSGTAWTRLVAHADAKWPAPSLVDQDRKHGTYVFAAALVYARLAADGLDGERYRVKARDGIMSVIGTENDPETRTLSVGRQLGSYVLAADLIRLSGADDSTFRSWLGPLRTRTFPAHGRWTSLKVTHEDSANNWGTWAGASLLAASLYLHDDADVAVRVRVVKGFFGDRSSWNDFRGQDEKNGALSADVRTWACDASPSGFLPINPPCVKNGINLDGAIVSDASRGGSLTFPVPDTGVMYTTEALQGLLIQTELLYRSGTDLWAYQSAALRRAGDFLSRTNGWNHGSINTGNAWLANKRLGTSYPRVTPSYSRMLAGYDFLYGP